MSGTIWDAAVDEINIKKENEAYKGIVTDKYVLVIGGKSSGKTTALLRFLNREEPTKPSVALEYTYARKTQMHGNMIGHIWELGGGTFLAKLLDIPLNMDTLKQMTVVLVLDLSDPKKLWYTAETLLEAARTRIKLVIRQESRNDPNLQQKIDEKSWRRVGGKDHPDAHVMDPFPVPLIIIGSKYDLFQDMESEQRKVIIKTMRFLSHINGATLLFLSNKVETTVRGLRHVMNHATFDADLNTKSLIDPQRPLYVPAGMDSFEGIGNPPVPSSDIGRLSSKNPVDMWRMAFCGHFPQQGEDKRNLTTAEDPAKDTQFLEPLVDEARAQKDRELEAYRRQEKNKWTRM
ncbi:cytoplasmic dynein 2 light intermediate chain 1-like [Styela clava]